jgi:hypothetical protein
MNKKKKALPLLDQFPAVSEVKTAVVLNVPLFPMLVTGIVSVISQMNDDIPMEHSVYHATHLLCAGISRELSLSNDGRVELRVFTKNDEDNDLLPEWFDGAFRRMMKGIVDIASLQVVPGADYHVTFMHTDCLVIVYHFNKGMLQ